jgi:ribosomal protein L7/L12
MFAVLEFSDYAIIATIVMLGSAAYSSFRPTDAARLGRLERKTDAILRHLNIKYVEPTSQDGLSEEVQKIANADNKIQAIKLHREQTGLGLKEAEDAVEEYMSRK